MSARPRRSTRQPVKFQETPVAAVVARPKRKARDAQPVDQIHFLLKSPKSNLTNMDISDLINIGTWHMLSPESQRVLKNLLPPTAFHGFEKSIELYHPSTANPMIIDHSASGSSSTHILDTSIFTDCHFLAAAHTFQDHIYSDWMSDAHAERVREYQDGIRNGTLSAAWKDDVWENNNRASQLSSGKQGVTPLSNVPTSSARAGEAAEVKLTALAKNGVLRVGDVIGYRRNFTSLDLVIEKDVIIQSIHPKTHAVTVLFEPGSTKCLPSYLLSPEPSEPSAPTQATPITSPTMLETGLLDADGRVEKTRRPNGNAWKCFTLWRWRGEVKEVANNNERGGRENHGTLFYLRGSYYHER